MEKTKVFVELFDEDHERKPDRRDFHFASTVTIAEIKTEIENFLGLSDVDIAVWVNDRKVESGTLLRASGGVSLASKLRVNYKLKQKRPILSVNGQERAILPTAGAIKNIPVPTYTYLNRDDDFICPICQELLSDPVFLSTCDHMFCSGCLKGLSVQHCQLDQHPFTEADKKPPMRIVRNRIEESRIKCNECGTEMKRGLSSELFLRHCEEECPQPCANGGCSWKGPLSTRISHLERDCTCNSCDQSDRCHFKGTKQDVQEHAHSNCEYATVTCHHGCGALFLRKESSSHDTACRIVEEKNRRVEEDRQAALNAQHEKILDMLNPGPADLIRLNVSGHMITISKLSIEKSKGSLLYALLNGARRLKSDESGVVVIDRPFLPFSFITDWLRTGNVPVSLHPELDRYLLYQEVDFWKFDTLREIISSNVFVEAQLIGARLQSHFLQNVRFCGADLRWANFEEADLSQADLNSAHLSNANLSNANLSDANLSNANLSNANLSNANLSNANLSKANLQDTKLVGCNLSGVDLSSRDLTGFDLSKANLSNANLSNANLSDANLSNANLSKANLQDTKLVGCNLSGVDLSSRDLTGFDLSKANLSKANLSKANLSNANLSNANLSNANLQDTKLVGCDLSGVDLSSRDLTGFDLSKANLSNANLSNANLNNADLRKATLSGSVRVGTQMRGAYYEDVVW